MWVFIACCCAVFGGIGRGFICRNLAHIDRDDAAPIAWYYAAMAKRIDIGRGFAAVMNHPEPGPTVFRMARAECSAFYIAVLRRRVMFRQTGRWGNLPPFFFDRSHRSTSSSFTRRRGECKSDGSPRHSVAGRSPRSNRQAQLGGQSAYRLVAGPGGTN